MEKIFHWTNTFKTLGESEDGSVDIKGLASTNALDRTGDVINHDAWIKNGGLDNFKGNPIAFQRKFFRISKEFRMLLLDMPLVQLHGFTAPTRSSPRRDVWDVCFLSLPSGV